MFCLASPTRPASKSGLGSREEVKATFSEEKQQQQQHNNKTTNEQRQHPAPSHSLIVHHRIVSVSAGRNKQTNKQLQAREKPNQTIQGGTQTNELGIVYFHRSEQQQQQQTYQYKPARLSYIQSKTADRANSISRSNNLLLLSKEGKRKRRSCISTFLL